MNTLTARTLGALSRLWSQMLLPALPRWPWLATSSSARIPAAETNATSYSASMGGSSFDGSDVSFVFGWEYETWFVCLV